MLAYFCLSVGVKGLWHPCKLGDWLVSFTILNMHFCAWMSTSLFSLWQTLTSARFWSGKIRLWQSRFSARPALSGCVHGILVLTRVECRRSRSSCSSLVRHSAPLVTRGGAVHAPLVGRAPRLACHHGLLGLLGVVRGVHRAVVGEVCRVSLKDKCRLVVLFPWCQIPNMYLRQTRGLKSRCRRS